MEHSAIRDSKHCYVDLCREMMVNCNRVNLATNEEYDAITDSTKVQTRTNSVSRHCLLSDSASNAHEEVTNAREQWAEHSGQFIKTEPLEMTMDNDISDYQDADFAVNWIKQEGCLLERDAESERVLLKTEPFSENNITCKTEAGMIQVDFQNDCNYFEGLPKELKMEVDDVSGPSLCCGTDVDTGSVKQENGDNIPGTVVACPENMHPVPSTGRENGVKVSNYAYITRMQTPKGEAVELVLVEPEQTIPLKRPFKCSFCGAGFVFEENCSKHELTCPKKFEQSHACKLCGQVVKGLEEMTYHLEIHFGHRPHKCGLCDKAFKTDHDRRQHEITHVTSCKKVETPAHIHLENKSHQVSTAMETVQINRTPQKCANTEPVNTKMVTVVPSHVVGKPKIVHVTAKKATGKAPNGPEILTETTDSDCRREKVGATTVTEIVRKDFGTSSTVNTPNSDSTVSVNTPNSDKVLGNTGQGDPQDCTSHEVTCTTKLSQTHPCRLCGAMVKNLDEMMSHLNVHYGWRPRCGNSSRCDGKKQVPHRDIRPKVVQIPQRDTTQDQLKSDNEESGSKNVISHTEAKGAALVLAKNGQKSHQCKRVFKTELERDGHECKLIGLSDEIKTPLVVDEVLRNTSQGDPHPSDCKKMGSMDSEVVASQVANSSNVVSILSRSEESVTSPNVSEIRYKCSFCELVFLHQEDCVRHELTCTTKLNQNHHCKLCGAMVKGLDHMTSHLEFHLGLRLHRCSQCEWAFKTKLERDRHECKGTKTPTACTRLGHTGGIPPQQATFVTESMHSDGKCQKTLTDGLPDETKPLVVDETVRRPIVANLTKLHTKHAKKSFLCSWCGKRFSQSRDLRFHSMNYTHTGDKHFKCRHCEKSFACKASRRNHEMAVHRVHFPTHGHDKKRQVVICQLCGKQFSREYFKIHSLIHTGEKPFKCSHCDKSFLWKSSFRTHCLLHTGEKPYKCTHCDKSFLYKSSLRKHCLLWCLFQ